MSDLNRREVLGMLAAAPLPALFSLPRGTLAAAWRNANGARAEGAPPYAPGFFTPHEWETVRILSDLIIPRDDHSASATEAGVPEFMDYVMVQWPENQVPMRGGLAWLDRECAARFGRPFTGCADSERTGMLDAIAWPKKAKPELTQGVAWFNSFRDFVASGFYSSEVGVEDLKYIGNTFVPAWNGCPPEVTGKLGVRY